MGALFVNNVDPDLHRNIRRIAFLAGGIPVNKTVEAIAANAMGVHHPYGAEVKRAVRVWRKAEAATA